MFESTIIVMTIGIRAAPSAVTFAVYDTKKNEVVNVEEIKIPAAFDVPSALKYLRSGLLDVLREYRIRKAGLRMTEGVADADPRRLQMEGVIQEAFASSFLESYFVGRIASISSRVGIDKSAFKPLINERQDGPVENWSQMSALQREAILCAIGAKNA